MSSSSQDSIPKPALATLPNIDDPKKVTDEEWRKILPPEVYNVTREAGTEPVNGQYDKFYKPGKYTCFCCGAELFVSDSKYDSGCGWPAFKSSIDKDKNILRLEDNSLEGFPRIEIRCKQCNAHLGHVFDVGNMTDTGEQYCVNSCAMNFEPKEN